METWLKNGEIEMKSSLVDTDLVWSGKDRRRRRGGGVGFLAVRDWKPKVAKVSKSEGLWVVSSYGGTTIYSAIVYLTPKDYDARNQTLLELVEDIAVFQRLGLTLVFGDFNARVGNLPNTVTALDSWYGEEITLPRQSEDSTINAPGSY